MFCCKKTVGALQLDTFAHLSSDHVLCSLPGGLVLDEISQTLALSNPDFNCFTTLGKICPQLVSAVKALTAACRKGGDNDTLDD